MSKRRKELTGMRFGRLVVLECVGKNKHNQYVWKCICDCGNIIDIVASNLLSGHTQSCGCLQKENTSKAHISELVGQKFYQLYVNKEIGRKNGSVLWECICNCGNIINVTTRDLQYGSVKSCGCLRSDGEKMIAQILDLYGVKYIREYGFEDCKIKRPMRFDFYLPTIGNNGSCIEFDGYQHFYDSRLYSSSISLDERKRRDKIKTEYCERNHIRLLRIPYWEKDNIESILTDWLGINDAEEANSSDVDLSA